MIKMCVIEHKSLLLFFFNGEPWSRLEPPGKAEMVEWRRDGAMEGEPHRGATALLQMNYSQLLLLRSVKDERKVWAAPAGLPGISSLQAGPEKMTHFKWLFSPKGGKNKHVNISGEHPANLQLLLQFTVESCQHCVRLLVPSDWSLNCLFVFTDWPENIKIHSMSNIHNENMVTEIFHSLINQPSKVFLPGDGGLGGQDSSYDVWFLWTVLLFLRSKLIFRFQPSAHRFWRRSEWTGRTFGLIKGQ